MKKFKDFLQESITRRTVSYGQGPKKKLGQIEIPPPKGSSSKPKKKTAKSAKELARIKKALDREKKKDKPGMTKRSDDYRKGYYQSGRSGAYFATKYAKEEMTTAADAGIPHDTANMGPKKKRKYPVTRRFIEVMGKIKKQMK